MASTGLTKIAFREPWPVTLTSTAATLSETGAASVPRTTVAREVLS